MRLTAATRDKTDSSPATSAVLESVSQPDCSRRFDLIATNAYYRAEERGFMPGHELDDWLTAETEVNTSEEGS